MRRRGFTWIEAVVVLAILGILAAILMPVFHHPNEGNPRRQRCQTNLKHIGLSFLQYAQDNDDKFPPVAVARSGNWAGSLQTYERNWSLFQCPTATKSRAKTTDYFYNARLAEVKQRNLFFAAQTVLAGDGTDDSPTNYALSRLPDAWRRDEKSPARRHLDGANYAFADGHVKWLQPDKIAARSTDKGSYSFALR